MTDTCPNDVGDMEEHSSKRNVIWIASYPKSGNTWVSSVLEVAGRHSQFPQGQYDSYDLYNRSLLPPDCPAVADEFRGESCSVLKTHSAYSAVGQPHYFPALELVTRAFIHIYRNPLDVLLSYLNYSRLEYRNHIDNDDYKMGLFVGLLGFERPIDYDEWARTGIDAIPAKNLDYALDAFSASGLALEVFRPMSGSWLENTRSWFDAARHIDGFNVRFEDCLRDHMEMTQLSKFFKFTPERIWIARSFVNKRTRRIAGGDETSKVFYNKMDAYYFHQYFSLAAIRRFCYANEEALKTYGYDSILNRT